MNKSPQVKIDKLCQEIKISLENIDGTGIVEFEVEDYSLTEITETQTKRTSS